MDEMPLHRPSTMLLPTPSTMPGISMSTPRIAAPIEGSCATSCGIAEMIPPPRSRSRVTPVETMDGKLSLRVPTMPVMMEGICPISSGRAPMMPVASEVSI